MNRSREARSTRTTSAASSVVADRMTADMTLTPQFSGRALPHVTWHFIHHGPLQLLVRPHRALCCTDPLRWQYPKPPSISRHHDPRNRQRR